MYQLTNNTSFSQEESSQDVLRHSLSFLTIHPLLSDTLPDHSTTYSNIVSDLLTTYTSITYVRDYLVREGKERSFLSATTTTKAITAIVTKAKVKTVKATEAKTASTVTVEAQAATASTVANATEATEATEVPVGKEVEAVE